MKKICCLVFHPVLLVSLTTSVHAMTINITYDVSVTNLANPALVQPAVATAVQWFQNQFTNAITVNITITFDPAVSLGQSDFFLIGRNYSQLTNALNSRRISAADFRSVASLPANDPIGPGTTWLIPRAEVKALGITGVGVDANDAVSDGTNTFAPPSLVSYTFDPTNRAVAGKIDFIGVVAHEISEVLGRVYLLNNGIVGYSPHDLFRFTNNAARSFDLNATNAYFSVDNGATRLKFFYTNANFGDVQDWQSSTPPDAFDAFVSSGKQLVLSSADVLALDTLGYNLVPMKPPVLTGTKLNGGTFRVSFTNDYSADFTVLAGTNINLALSNWTALGAPVENPFGTYQFTDSQATTNQRRFYRVRSP